MKLLDGNVLPGDTLTVDGDMKRGEIRLERARAKAVQG
jgi:type III secretory pathway component EscV